jgi:hypothetical protein
MFGTPSKVTLKRKYQKEMRSEDQSGEVSKRK